MLLNAWADGLMVVCPDTSTCSLFDEKTSLRWFSCLLGSAVFQIQKVKETAGRDRHLVYQLKYGLQEEENNGRNFTGQSCHGLSLPFRHNVTTAQLLSETHYIQWHVWHHSGFLLRRAQQHTSAQSSTWSHFSGAMTAASTAQIALCLKAPLALWKV